MIDRRTTLLSSVVLLVGATASGVATTSSAVPQQWPLWSALDHADALVALGRGYARLLPEFGAKPAAELAGELCRRLHLAMQGESSSVAAALRRSMVEDFRREEVRAVDGWILSVTEILLAVLAFRSFTHDEAEPEIG